MTSKRTLAYVKELMSGEVFSALERSATGLTGMNRHVGDYNVR